MFNYESYGTPINNPNNGFVLGKKWMDVQLAMWHEDIDKGLLLVSELYDDPTFPHWWLDRNFKLK